MFRDIVPPDLPRLTCQDVKIPNVEVYYQAAGELFGSAAFTAKQRKDGEHLHFLEE